MPRDPLTYPYDAPPAPGHVQEVAEGVFWLRMPMPFKLDHINLWLLADGDSWLVVDSGFPADQTRHLWEKILTSDAGARKPSRMICTHFHPDHVGLSGWFQREFGTSLLMSRTEWLTANYLSRVSDADYAAGQGDFFRRHGLEQARCDALTARGNAYAKRLDRLPASYHRLQDGDQLTIGGRNWRVMAGRGHAPEQLCLYCRELKLLISADQILPRITPNVSVPWFEPDAQPLADYLDSLEDFRDLPDDILILPSHRLPFRGLAARLDELVEHHDERLAQVVDACGRGARTASDILPVLFGPELDDHHVVFAMGEAVAHLAYLSQRGDLRQDEDAEGRVVFEVARSGAA